ncbi:MAG: hypothetical protein ACOYLU_03915, partial [Limisphaerales bacterium]
PLRQGILAQTASAHTRMRLKFCKPRSPMGSAIHRGGLKHASKPSNCHPEAPEHAKSTASRNQKDRDDAL